jgi:DnaJ-class molecular chaperone
MNYYDILGVPKNATQDQIKKQYRKLSLECHPDRPNGNESKFKMLNEAYEILGDEVKRKQNDKPEINLMDMFQHDMFSPTFIFKTLMKPPPLNVHLTLTLEQAYTGCKVPIHIERWIHRHQIKELETETCYVDIPPGVDSNECMMLPNKGNMGSDGSMGDIRIILQIKPHCFERVGLDLVYTHTITLKESLCGFSFELNYLQQCYKINNPKGNIIHPSYIKEISGMGMKRDSNVGKLIIKFNITFPPVLSDEVIQSIESLL